ncbi:hypothetical protein NYO91_07260 [Arhodomonas aquaeolei]|uniref:Mor transcription activator family protein n=1 Tax=Arhodomonas aquaeolei TaxID=2369 RepID=UPI00216A8198|nr:Mor transcription activator family protein [Arhodomonas aquaeolei]MCS4503874.1 hypothetical protein [Arhodomonas aquaeolei]
MTAQTEHLPHTLTEVVETIGMDTTLQLVESLGGVRVYVPENMRPDHVLVRVIGHRAAWRMAERFGGEPLVLPRCAASLRAERNARIRRERAGGATPAQLALRYGLTERQVYAILAAGEPEDDGQQPLL